MRTTTSCHAQHFSTMTGFVAPFLKGTIWLNSCALQSSSERLTSIIIAMSFMLMKRSVIFLLSARSFCFQKSLMSKLGGRWRSHWRPSWEHLELFLHADPHVGWPDEYNRSPLLTIIRWHVAAPRCRYLGRLWASDFITQRFALAFCQFWFSRSRA